MKRFSICKNGLLCLPLLALSILATPYSANAEPVKDPYHPHVNGSPVTLMKDNMLTQTLGGRIVDLDVWAGEFIKFDDNIFNTASNKKSDVIYSSAVGMKMEAEQKDSWKMRVEGQVQYNAYGDHSEYNGLEGYFHSSGSIQLSPALTTRIAVNYDNTYDNIRNVEDIYAMHQFSVAGGFTVMPSPYFGVDVDYNYFGQRRDVSILDYQNYDEHSVSVRPFYALSPHTTVYMQLSGGIAEPNGHDNRYNTAQMFTAVTGISWKYKDAAQLYAEVGYKFMSFDDNGTIRDHSDVNRPLFRIGGDYALSPDWKAGASVSSASLYGGVTSNASNSNYLDRVSLNAFLAYSPGAGRFTAKLSPYFTSNDPSADVSYKDYGVHFGVSYSFTDWFNMSAGYRYSVMDYSDQSSYDRNIFTIGFAATF